MAVADISLGIIPLVIKAIPETLVSGNRQRIVMVEGRRPRCWGCKQIGHIAKFLPPEDRKQRSSHNNNSYSIHHHHHHQANRDARPKSGPTNQPTRRDGLRWPGRRKGPQNRDKQAPPHLPQNKATEAGKPAAEGPTPKRATSPAVPASGSSSISSDSNANNFSSSSKTQKEKVGTHGGQYKSEEEKGQRGKGY